MQIRLKCSCGAENCPEWAVVELQGTVELNPSIQNHLQNLEIGQLCRHSPSSSSSSQETYTFTIGYHELTGSKVTLKKPLLVLKKVKNIMDEDLGDGHSNDSSSKVELDVIGIIRHKILFKTRPKALISNDERNEKKKPENKLELLLCSSFGSSTAPLNLVSTLDELKLLAFWCICLMWLIWGVLTVRMNCCVNWYCSLQEIYDHFEPYI